MLGPLVEPVSDREKLNYHEVKFGILFFTITANYGIIFPIINNPEYQVLTRYNSEMASAVFGLILSVVLCAGIFLKRKMIDLQIQMSVLMIFYELIGIFGVGLIGKLFFLP